MRIAIPGPRSFRVLALSSVLMLAACGPVSYTVDVARAERTVAAARAGNATYYAPYELYFAETYLAKAREEAAEGAYEDALHLIEIATAYGKRALERSGSRVTDSER